MTCGRMSQYVAWVSVIASIMTAGGCAGDESAAQLSPAGVSAPVAWAAEEEWTMAQGRLYRLVCLAESLKLRRSVITCALGEEEAARAFAARDIEPPERVLRSVLDQVSAALVDGIIRIEDDMGEIRAIETTREY